MKTKRYKRVFILIIIIVSFGCNTERYSIIDDDFCHGKYACQTIIFNLKIRGNKYKYKLQYDECFLKDNGYVTYSNDTVYFETKRDNVRKCQESLSIKEKLDTTLQDSIKLIFRVTESKLYDLFYYGFYINGEKEYHFLIGDTNATGFRPNLQLGTQDTVIFFKGNKLKSLHLNAFFSILNKKYTPLNSNSNVFIIYYDTRMEANPKRDLTPYVRYGVKKRNKLDMHIYQLSREIIGFEALKIK